MDEPSGHEHDTAAALLTAAALRFEMERLPRNPAALPWEDPGRLGEIAFMFVPRHELITDAELVGYLECLPKPVLFGALAEKGIIATWWPSQLDDRGRQVWERALKNQVQQVASIFENHRLTDSDLILVETTIESLLTPAGALRHWGRDLRSLRYRVAHSQ